MKVVRVVSTFGDINLIYPGSIVTYRCAETFASIGFVATGGSRARRQEWRNAQRHFGANGWQCVSQLNTLANPNLIYPVNDSATDHNHRGL